MKKYTLSYCKKISSSCSKRSEFAIKFPYVYKICLHNGWLDKCIPKKHKWTKKQAIEIANMCNSKVEFRNLPIYRYGLKYGWGDDVLNTIDRKHKWTLEKCKEVAKKYKSKIEFKNKHTSAYSACVKNKWISLVCSHMKKTKKSPDYWTLRRCIQEFNKYNKYKDYPYPYGAYIAIVKNGWKDKVNIRTNRIL